MSLDEHKPPTAGVETGESDGAVAIDDDRGRFAAMIVGVLILVVAGVGYVMWASARADEDIATREARAARAVDDFEAASRDAGGDSEPDGTTAAGLAYTTTPLIEPGDVVVVHQIPGEDYERLAVRHLDGTRTLLDRRCMRVHVAAGRGYCLRRKGTTPASAFRAEYFDLETGAKVGNIGFDVPLPSRARLSPDGRISAMTGFVTGSSYADIGGEAETRVIIDEVDTTGGRTSLTQFRITTDDARYQTPDRQFWGPTFADDDTFWVTGFYGEAPEIMKGSLVDRTLEPTGWSGSCPSLSPDGSTVVFKEAQADGSYALVAVDVATERRWHLGESRSVDDQVEWLDDDTILYALHPETEVATVQPQFDIWMLDIAEGSTPTMFLPAASSPAVVRSTG